MAKQKTGLTQEQHAEVAKALESAKAEVRKITSPILKAYLIGSSKPYKALKKFGRALSELIHEMDEAARKEGHDIKEYRGFAWYI